VGKGLGRIIDGPAVSELSRIVELGPAEAEVDGIELATGLAEGRRP
jgi:hypothetical protein